jgi:hypothetical protein
MQKADEQRLSDIDSFEHIAEDLWERTKLRAGIGLKKRVKLWPRIAVAAAAVAAITLSIWLYYTPRHHLAHLDFYT